MTPRLSRIVLLLLCLTVPLAAPAEQAAEPLDRIVVIVNDDIIAQSELDEQLRNVKQQLRQQNSPMPPEDVLRRQVLERLILARLQLQLAQRFAIYIDDLTLDRTLENIAAQNKLSVREFRDVLERDGFRYERFREDIRKEITISRLRQREVENRITVTDQEVDSLLATQAVQGSSDDDYHLSHILIAVPEGATPAQIAEKRERANGLLAQLNDGADFIELAIANSDGQQALQGGDLGWRKLGQLPTLFVNVVARMEVGEISELIRSPSGFHIITLNERRGQEAQRHIVQQTRARHILIRPDEMTSSADVQLKLQRVRERIEGGDDFAELARAHSGDRASASKGGELGWLSPGETVPEFERVMNELAVGQLSAPFRSEYGWHIVQVLERRSVDNTEEFRRTRARADIRQRKIEEEYQLWLRRLRDESFVEYRN